MMNPVPAALKLALKNEAPMAVTVPVVRRPAMLPETDHAFRGVPLEAEGGTAVTALVQEQMLHWKTELCT